MKRKKTRLPVFLEPEEYAKLIRKPNKSAPTGLRNLCIIRIMAEAGLRVSDVIGAQWEKMNLNTGKLFIVGKGDKERMVVLNASLMKLLVKCFRSGPLMFCTLAGKPLHDRYIRTMIKRYAVKAKIKKDVHPHVLRHTFATLYLRQTKDLRTLQKILGHARITTTEIYAHVVDEEIESSMREFKI